MKNYLLLFAILYSGLMSAQTIWTGEKITFSKDNFADPTLAENQDRITDSVWITRGTIQGIFNIKKELAYKMNSSPIGTEWAFGTSAGLDSLTFKDWQTTINNNPPLMVNKDMVVHLIAEDIYIDIKFLSWAVGTAGGGFSYERSSDPVLSTRKEEMLAAHIKVFPNPSSQRIMLDFASDSNDPLRLVLLDMSGKKCMSELKSIHVGNNLLEFDLGTLSPGMYLMKLKQGNKWANRKIIVQ
ncbi:MAG: T9SS type A sorting domain-containing protein [Saprospiraceae bacterium]